ncbi:stress response protein NST1 [Drosophila ficusphila]|uniref:stress response protein NST1 n=1 Tax=Drosophila ficusphila TaxID=30025 RepID=UPI0007E7D2AA|nr:stress response protein NST1 [Drosophila ficusphila]
MAFVARRSSDGSVVDRQQISGRRSLRPLTLSDVSDSEDSESVLGYTDRTFGAPTVRFVGQGDGESDVDGGAEPQPETKPVDTYTEPDVDVDEDVDKDVDIRVGDPLEDSASETNSILSFCNQLDEEEAKDALREGLVSYGNAEDSEEPEEGPENQMEPDQMSLLGKADDAAATDTETVMNLEHDGQSLSSFDSYTPTVTQRAEELDNLDTLSGRTFFKPDSQYSQDNVSGKTFFKQEGQDRQVKQERQDRDEQEQGQMSSRTYDLSSRGSKRSTKGSSKRGSSRLHDGSSVSTCSWTEMYGRALEPADVPSLSLASANSEASTYYKSLEETKERQGQAAYEEWKARKAAQKQRSLLAAKQEREKQEAEAALRHQLSQERFQEWCRRKEQQQQQQQLIRKKASSRASPSGSGHSSVSGSVSGLGTGSGPAGSAARCGPARTVPPEVTKKRLKEWERVKREQQQSERERLQKLEANKRKLEAERKQRSQGAWKNWMKQVDKRAKPVPLNQGFDTLRGTISNIYINPVQWVSNIDPQDSGRSR